MSDMHINENFEEVVTNKKFLTFKQASTKAREIQDLCHDYSVQDVTVKNMHYSAEDNKLVFTNEAGTRSLNFTPHSLGQLCSRLGIPVKYITKCIESGNPYLAAENINDWLEDYHKDVFVRGYDESVRGILSSRYAVMDAPDVIDVFHDNLKGYEVRGITVTPERLHMRVTQKETMKVKGEDLFAGVTLDSSDVGRSTLTVRFFVYKQICTNGMCISESMGNIYVQRHVGLTKDEFNSELKEGVAKIPVLVDTVTSLIKTANKDKSVEYNKWNDAEQERFNSRIKALTRLSEKDIANVINLMYGNYAPTQWGLINAITEQAQNYTLERRLELENVAGSILLHPMHIAA